MCAEARVRVRRVEEWGREAAFERKWSGDCRHARLALSCTAPKVLGRRMHPTGDLVYHIGEARKVCYHLRGRRAKAGVHSKYEYTATREVLGSGGWQGVSRWKGGARVGWKRSK